MIFGLSRAQFGHSHAPQGIPTPWPPSRQVGTHLAEIFSILPVTGIRAYFKVEEDGVDEWPQTTELYDFCDEILNEVERIWI